MKKFSVMIAFIAAMFVVTACGKKKQEEPQAAAAGGQDTSMDQGKKLFAEKTCTSCHGEDGTGNTPAGKAVKARNFTTDKFKQGDTVEAVAKTILKGIPGTGMAPFEGSVSPEEAKILAKYVLSFKK